MEDGRVNIMGADLYPAGSASLSIGSQSNYGLWPVTGSGGEIDLRQEFYEFLYGSSTEIAKGRLGIIRKARKDDNGDLITCPCVSELTGEPDLDTPCPYCNGFGYIYDEEWITYYKMLISSHEGLVRKNQPHKAGISNIPFVFFYVEYNVDPERHDSIIEVKLDSSGQVVIPIVRTKTYKINTVEDFRSDNGRIEYYRIAVIEDSVKSTWQ